MEFSGFICSTAEYAPREMMKTSEHILIFFIKTCLFVSISLLFISCGSTGRKHTDTPTSGVLIMGSDDSYKPVIDAEIQVFQSLYQNTAIHVKYEPEDSLFTDLIHDSVRIIVAGKQLTPKEVSYFQNKLLLSPEQVKIATDALAIIVNNDNPDTMFTLDKIKAIFRGDSTWDSPCNGKITVVFDHENSGNSRYIRENLMNGSKFPAYCFALNSNPEVIDYVSKNKQALGIIGVNWVSNDYDSATVGFLTKVKIAWISASADANHFQPYQYYIKTGDYPLCRDVYMIKTEPYVGLGSGFMSFVTSDKGQRIILKEGILPATVPTRIISF
jgi:phosphate transport system substrate-binding protein